MFQFTHAEGYARSSSKKVITNKKTGKTIRSPKRNIDEIIAEVMRDPDACPHVENPEPPTFLFGDEPTLRAMPNRIAKNIEAWEKTHKTVRKDAQVLFTEIVSYQRGVGTEEDYLDWERRNVEHLKKKHGDRLVAVVMHDDEAHRHLHAYVVPLEGEDPNIKTALHPGHAAVARAAAAYGKADPKQQASIFKAAMREYQNQYYEAVGMFCGMTRLGPGKRRLDRSGHFQEKTQSEAIKYGLAMVERRQQELDAEKANLDSLIASQAQEQAKVLKRQDAVKLMHAATPEMPAEPSLWESKGSYIESLKKIIKLQVAKLALLPEMKNTMAIIRAEGAKIMKERDSLVDQVKILAEHAHAWAVVQQVFPDVAREVVRRMNKPATPVAVAPVIGEKHTVAFPTLDPVLST